MRSTDTSQPFDDDGVIPQLPQNMGGSFANVTQNKGHDLGEQAPQLPLIPSATHAISKGIDNLTGGYTETPADQKNWNQGIEFAASIPAGGGVASLAKQGGSKGLEKVANFAGSTNPWHAAGAGAAGYTMGKLEDSGSSTGGAIAGGLAAGLGVNSLPNALRATKKIPDLTKKAAVSFAGLGKKNFNIDAAKNAKELGIDLPATPFTDSSHTRFADQISGTFGTKLRSKYENAGEQTKKVLEDIYDATGPRKTEEVQKEISSLYNQRVRDLPEDAVIKPTNTLKAVEDIRIDSIHTSPDEKKLLDVVNSYKNELSPTIKSQFGDFQVPLQDSKIQRLADSKRSLNDLIKWDVDQSVQNQAKKIQKGLADDIAEYGKANPEWYKTFKEADELFGKVAKRERLEKELGHKSTNFADKSISYNKLSKVIHDPESKAILKKNATPEIMKKLEKLGTIAEAMVIKNKNVPNPSGTAAMGAVLALIGGVFTSPIKTLKSSVPLTVAGTLATTKLLTDKRLIDLAIQFAEKPTEQASVSFSRRMKQITGYTPVTLAREAAKREQETQEKSGVGLKKKFNNHTESNKQKPKGQALEKLMQTNAAKKGAQILGANPWR